MTARGALALELFAESIASWTDATARHTVRDTAEASIRGSVLGLLDWARTEPGQFRFMDELRVLSKSLAELGTCATELAAGESKAAALYAGWSDEGFVRALPWPVAHALLLGPAYDFARSESFAQSGQHEDALIADAAWSAVGMSDAFPHRPSDPA